MDTKEVKKAIGENVEDLQKKAQVELKKVKKEMEQATKKVEGYIKKNPAKAALISTGIGAAIGAALAFVMRRKKGKK